MKPSCFCGVHHGGHTSPRPKGNGLSRDFFIVKTIALKTLKNCKIVIQSIQNALKCYSSVFLREKEIVMNRL